MYREESLKLHQRAKRLDSTEPHWRGAVARMAKNEANHAIECRMLETHIQTLSGQDLALPPPTTAATVPKRVQLQCVAVTR